MNLLSIFKRSKGEIKTGGELLGPNIFQPHHAEEIRAHNKKQTRMYEASITSNLNLDFVPTVSSANADALTGIYISRGRHRTLENDDATMSGILRSVRSNVVGDDPFRLEMAVKKPGSNPVEFEDEINARIEEAWKEAGKPKNCTVRKDMSRLEMYLTLITAAKRDGSVLIRHHRMFPFNQSRYAVELIENDRLQESYVGKSDEGNLIEFSIERHPKFKFPIYYWILSRHPGDVFPYAGSTSNVWRERVSADDIIHFNNFRPRAEQDIGVPCYNPIIQHLHLNRQFDRAHVSAAVWSAAKPFFIIQKYPTGMQMPGDPSPFFNQVNIDGQAGQGAATGSIANQRGDGRGGGKDILKQVQPATGEKLDMGLEPYLVDPKFPNEAAESFKKTNGQLTAVGSGLSYAGVTGDYEKMSFSVARSAQIPERDNYKIDQQLMIVNFVEQHFNVWLKCELLYGTLMDLPFSRYEEFCKAAKFNPKRWPYIQPVQDAEADSIALELRVKTHQDILNESEGGGKFSDKIATLASENEIAEAHGIDLNQEVTLATIKKGEPSETTPPLDDETPPKKNGRFHLNGDTD